MKILSDFLFAPVRLSVFLFFFLQEDVIQFLVNKEEQKAAWSDDDDANVKYTFVLFFVSCAT